MGGGGWGDCTFTTPKTWLVLLFFCFSLICNFSCYSEDYNTCLLEAAQSITSGEGEKDITAGVSSYITNFLSLGLSSYLLFNSTIICAYVLYTRREGQNIIILSRQG